MVKTKAQPVLKAQVFRVEYSPDEVYMIELLAIYSHRLLNFETFGRAWLSKDGDMNAIEVNVDDYLRSLSPKRLVEKIAWQLHAHGVLTGRADR